MKNSPHIRLYKYFPSIIFMIVAFFVTASSSVAFAQSIQVQQFRTNLFEATASTNLLDATVIHYSSEGNNAVNGKDAVKIVSISPGTHLGMLRDGVNLILERRRSITANDTIFYNLMTASKRNYRFEFIADNLDVNAVSGFLEDAYLGTSTPVNLNGNTTVDFTVNGEVASSASNRFRIVFQAKVINGKMKVLVKTSISKILVYPNPVVDGKINIKFINQTQGNYVLKLFNNFGRVVNTKEIYVSESNATETMKSGRNMIKGAYQLEVFSLCNRVASIKVLVL